MNKINEFLQKALLFIAVFCAVLSIGKNIALSASYFVSATGNDDANSGTTPQTAWATIGRVNSQVLSPGDSVSFESGSTFLGTLDLSQGECGTDQNPIIIQSYGAAKATINAANGSGIVVNNCGGITVKNLRITGSGVYTNIGKGIDFSNNLSGDIRLTGVKLEWNDISGFRYGGISIKGNQGNSGYRNLRIRRNYIHDNGQAGIEVKGVWTPNRMVAVDAYPHQGVIVAWNTVYHNVGDPDANNYHTGNGIVVSQAAQSLIERNVASYNGQNNDHSGGPVGMWFWDSYLCVIQYNESHHNLSQTNDGGGFDLDGGVQSCIMQYNYSHDNWGPGYLIAQFDNSGPMNNVTLRYNISHGDARRGQGTGSISIWNGDTGGPAIGNFKIYNNTIYTSSSDGLTRNAVAVTGSAPIENLYFSNNIFYTDNSVMVGIPNIYAETFFINNLYHNSTGPFTIREYGITYTSLSDWQNRSQQETLDGIPVGFQANPLLDIVGPAVTLNNASLLSSLNAYKIISGSPALDTALNLGWWGVNIGIKDFYGNSLSEESQADTLDMGAHELH